MSERKLSPLAQQYGYHIRKVEGVNGRATTFVLFDKNGRERDSCQMRHLLVYSAEAYAKHDDAMAKLEKKS